MPIDLADTLLWLCRVPSPIGEERALCDAVSSRLGALGIGPIRRYGDSIVVSFGGKRSGPAIALVGHLDVVRTVHDALPRIEGDRLYGAGAADMKSGLALMLDLAHSPPDTQANVTLVFYAREEGPYAENELGRVLAEDTELTRVALAIALEPSDNKLQLGCGGSVHARVSFAGRTAHSARPWQGDNAIHKAGPLLARLAAREPVASTIDGLTWHDVISATLAEGGRARNIIPDRFELNLNHRFGPDKPIAASEAAIAELVAGDAEIEFVDRSPPAPPCRGNALIEALRASGVRAVEPKQAWTDVGRFAALGVVAANFGPGVQAQAHQRNEWTSIAQLEEGRAILRRWLASIGPIAVVALALTVLASCQSRSGRHSGRAEVVASSAAAAPSATLFTPGVLEGALLALQHRVGSGASVLELELDAERAVLQVEASEERGRVVQYEWRGGAVHGPIPVELRGPGTLEVNLFPLSAINLSAVPDLVPAAIQRVDPDHGTVERILVRRNLPVADDVGMRVYVRSPIRSGHVDADGRGRLTDAARLP